MEARFTVLTLGVKDLETSMRFYRDGLGFFTQGVVGKEFERGEVVFFNLKGGMMLALYQRDNLAWDANVKLGDGVSPFSIGYNTATKEEVDNIIALAEAAGATIPKRPQDTFWGGYAGYFLDPDRHPWEILWNPNLLPD